jgi:uncharacterized protein (UPF0332 family)
VNAFECGRGRFVYLREFSRSLHPGFDLRQVSDYVDLWMVSQEETETLFSEAGVFVGGVEHYLNKQG